MPTHITFTRNATPKENMHTAGKVTTLIKDAQNSWVKTVHEADMPSKASAKQSMASMTFCGCQGL